MKADWFVSIDHFEKWRSDMLVYGTAVVLLGEDGRLRHVDLAEFPALTSDTRSWRTGRSST